MKVGDRIKVTHEYAIFTGCEGYIVEVESDGSYLVDLYKGNDIITEDEINEYYVYFTDKELELI